MKKQNIQSMNDLLQMLSGDGAAPEPRKPFNLKTADDDGKDVVNEAVATAEEIVKQAKLLKERFSTFEANGKPEGEPVGEAIGALGRAFNKLDVLMADFDGMVKDYHAATCPNCIKLAADEAARTGSAGDLPDLN